MRRSFLLPTSTTGTLKTSSLLRALLICPDQALWVSWVFDSPLWGCLVIACNVMWCNVNCLNEECKQLLFIHLFIHSSPCNPLSCGTWTSTNPCVSGLFENQNRMLILFFSFFLSILSSNPNAFYKMFLQTKMHPKKKKKIRQDIRSR